jgi:2-polyprenyl-3-methyl-5-hydroxy-6-metoxy-1,4-benzoquinol methylase
MVKFFPTLSRGARMPTREELSTRQRFADRYREGRTPVVEQIERAVIGGDWGANGYTTTRQADRLAEALALRPGHRLLDLGAGRGWPGLYLAVRTGCHVVVTDVPKEGLRQAMLRAAAEHVADRAAAVASSARSLPFHAGTFDAVVHTDVLC